MPNDQQAPAQVTTLSTLRQPAAPEQHLPVVRMGFNDLQGFELMQRGGRALASSTLVPKEYQNNLPNCLIALEMAARIGASPLQVMQNLYVVHGRPSWSSKFLIASFNQCGRFSAIRYQWVGDRGNDTWGCRAWAVEKATQEKIEGPLITIDLSKKEGWYQKNGSKWQTIPELMLMYRSAGWLVNTHAPEISMGLNTAEELGDTFDAARSVSGEFEVTTTELRQQNGSPVAPTEPTVDKETGEVKATEGGAPVINRERIAAMLGAATSGDDVDAALDLMASSDINAADQDYLRDQAKAVRAKVAK